MKKNGKMIMCLVASILFFFGMCLEFVQIDSSFLYVNATDATVIRMVDHTIDGQEACILGMIKKESSTNRHNTYNHVRWQPREVLLFLIIGVFQQYLFTYQSAECKEDGQLLLCRYVPIGYIHQQDGEKWNSLK